MSTETAPTIKHPPADDNELLTRIREFIAEAADTSLERVDPDANIYTDLGTDSLGGACIFIEISFEFGIPEPKEAVDYVPLDTARKILAYVREQEAKLV